MLNLVGYSNKLYLSFFLNHQNLLFIVSGINTNTKEQLIRKVELLEKRILDLEKAKNDNIISEQLSNKLLETNDKLKTSEETYRNIFNNAQVGLFRTRIKDGKLLEINDTLAIMSGYDSREQYIKEYDPEKEYVDAGTRERMLKEITSKGFINNFEARFYNRDGSIMWTSFSAKIFPDKGWIEGVLEDITYRKTAEEKLKESEQRANEILNSSGFQMWAFNGEIYSYINAEYHNFTGQDANMPLTIERWISVVHPDDIESSGKIWAENFDAKTEHDNYFRLRRHDGEYRNFHCHAKPIFNDDGSFKYFQGYNLDITERILAEETLHKSETNYQNLYDIVPDGVYKSTETGVFMDVNPAMVRMFGYDSKEELMAIDIKTQLYFDVEDRESVTLKKNMIEMGVYRLKKKDGSEIWVEDHGWLTLDKKTNNIFHEGIMRDVTDRKRIEESQKIILEISQIADEHTTLHSFLASVHKKIKTIIRAKNLYIALYDKVTDTYTFPYHQDEIDVVEPNETYNLSNGYTDYVRKTGKTKLITVNSKSKILDPNIIGYGETPSAWLGVPLKIEHHDEVIGVITIQYYSSIIGYTEFEIATFEIIAHNISKFIQRVKYLEDLKLAKEKAEESDRLKSAFLSNMSHEIRTPMNGILGFSDLLKDPELSGNEQQEYIEVIEKSGARMLNTINDIMDISKVESGQMEVSLSEVFINDQLDYLFTFFKPEADKKGIVFTSNIGLTRSESIIKTDSEKLYSILTNLIKNAIKYTEVGKIEFGYTKNHSNLKFFVRDTGMGIPDNRQDAVFDRFVQADIEDKNALEGSGLGLAISKAYVEMLDGKIWLESKEDIGSTFYFTIPYERVTLTEEKDETKIITEFNSYLKERKVLIVEDDEASYEFLKILLENEGVNTILALNGEESIKRCKEDSNIDLVLMDINMMVMNGLTATKEIKKFRPDLPIIAQTAYAIAGDREKTIKAGCDDYITKPIKKEILMEVIGKWIKV